MAQLTKVELRKRLLAALKAGPRSRAEIIRDVFAWDVNGRALDEVFESLVKAGKARHFTNWPFDGGARVEFWTLTPQPTK